MNIFIIPSWYPSPTQPFAGIFFKEQAEALAHTYPQSNLALSTWGSHEEGLLLWGKEPFTNLKKLVAFPFKESFEKNLANNLVQYYSPALTWSRRFLQGNINRIIRINEKHFLSFQEKAGPVHVIHAHSAFPAGWVAMVLAKKYRLPYLITEHMGPFPFKDFLLKSGELSPYLTKPFQSAFTNIAVSPQQKQTLESRGIPRVQHIPNLVNEDFFSPLSSTDKKHQPFTFFTLASLQEGKGITYLLKAFKLFTEQQPDSFLHIGGAGPERANYEALAAKLEIADKVAWLGFIDRPEVLKEFRQCDAFILPSLHENLPLVLLEALACGKPLISTRCGGPESIIKPHNGLLVEPANGEVLFSAMVQMHQNYPSYDRKRIREDFCNRYSRPVVCRQIMDVYEAATRYLGGEH